MNNKIMTLKSIPVDLPDRKEIRYLLPFPNEFLEKISPLTERKKFSDNEFVQTIYFNDDDHTLPFELSIKARRYLPNYPEYPSITDENYFLDVKKTFGEIKQKVRVQGTLTEIKEFLGAKFPGMLLRPYMIVEFFRQHYVPKAINGIRITVDTDIRYFFVSPDHKKCVEIGREKYGRLEIKEKNTNESFAKSMENIISELNLFQIISKKFKAHGYLDEYYSQRFGKPFHKELIGIEIESKITAESEDIFPSIKHFFENGYKGFVLVSHFPYTFDSASINRYYRNEKGLFKAMFFGDEIAIVIKKEDTILKDPFDLNCIMHRKEIKGLLVPLDSGIIKSATLEGQLHRVRRAIWIENTNTRRFYHISLDCCEGLPGTLYQIEVEYTGKLDGPKSTNDGKENVINEVVMDIAQITKILLEKFPQLKPSTLTKYGWLGIKY